MLGELHHALRVQPMTWQRIDRSQQTPRIEVHSICDSVEGVLIDGWEMLRSFWEKRCLVIPLVQDAQVYESSVLLKKYFASLCIRQN